MSRWVEDRKADTEVERYLKSRGFTEETLDTFQIGYETDVKSKNKGRIIFPIFNPYAEYLGYQARAFNTPKDESKYRISTGLAKNEVLYGMHLVKKTAVEANYLILTEGNPDVMTLWQHGIPAVAPMGTSLSKFQSYLIARYVDIVLLVPNNDERGLDAARRSYGILTPFVSEVEFIYLPKSFNDVNEFYTSDPKQFQSWVEKNNL